MNDDFLFHLPIFWYSKYCRYCTGIIDRIDPNDFRFVCVDHVDVRKLLLADTKYGVRSVPCIMILRDNGRALKYEGAEEVLTYLEETSRLTMVSNNASEPEPPTTPLPLTSPPRPRGGSLSSPLPPIPEVFEEEEPSAFEGRRPLVPPPLEPPTMELDRPQDGVDVMVTMEVAEDGVESDPSGMSESSSSSSSNVARKGNSVLTLAQQMQRERESEDRSSPPSV